MDTYIGTCGWSYKDDWMDVFYPQNLKPAKFLEFYSKIFNSVEIDSSFYHIPHVKTVKSWIDKTSSDFKFSAKLPQEITHKSKLKLNKIIKKRKITDILKNYIHSMKPLEENNRMLAHLIQLPPSFDRNENLDELESFLNHWNEVTEQKWRPVVEFRNKSWNSNATFDLLERYKVGYCAVIEPEFPPIMDLTRTDLFYLRFHGFGKKPWWNYHFSEKELNKWSEKIYKVFKQNPEADKVVYFNNHFSGNAVKNAMDIMPKLKFTLKNTLKIVQQMPQFSQKVKDRLEIQSLNKWI